MMAGTFWTTSSFAYRYALRLLSTIVVTRLLDPSAYGLMSLAMIFVTGLSLFSDIGIGPSVIRSPRGENTDFLQTAWTMKILRGVFIGLMGCSIAWPAAMIYDEPRLIALICALSLLPVLDGVTSISSLVCQRQINLFRVNLIEVLSATLSVFLTILFAWYLRSVWALVIGALGGSVLKMVASHILLPPFKHRIHLNRTDAMEILTFGGWILLATIVTFLGGRGLILIQGALVSVDVLGFLALADTLAWAMGELVSLILVKVYFPAMSQVARDRPDELPEKVYKIQTIVYFGLAPLFVILSLVAAPLIDVLYDPRYAIVGTFLPIMAINSALAIMVMPYNNVVLAQGDGRMHFVLIGVAAVLRIVPLFAGYHIAGTLGMIFAMGLGIATYNLFSIYVAARKGFVNVARDLCILALMVAILTLTYLAQSH